MSEPLKLLCRFGKMAKMCVWVVNADAELLSFELKTIF